MGRTLLGLRSTKGHFLLIKGDISKALRDYFQWSDTKEATEHIDERLAVLTPPYPGLHGCHTFQNVLMLNSHQEWLEYSRNGTRRHLQGPTIQGASNKTLELHTAQRVKYARKRFWNACLALRNTIQRDQVKSIPTLATADLSEIRRMETSLYAVSVPQHRYIFPETVPFPRRLHNYCCDDLKEASKDSGCY
ncbi:hypothetical protein Tco_1125785 [Tanacetum coccineum]